jgi:hypothetical protein
MIKNLNIDLILLKILIFLIIIIIFIFSIIFLIILIFNFIFLFRNSSNFIINFRYINRIFSILLILDYSFENIIKNINIKGILETFITNVFTKFDIIIILYISNIIIIISILVSIIKILERIIIFSIERSVVFIIISLTKNTV